MAIIKHEQIDANYWLCRLNLIVFHELQIVYQVYQKAIKLNGATEINLVGSLLATYIKSTRTLKRKCTFLMQGDELDHALYETVKNIFMLTNHLIYHPLLVDFAQKLFVILVIFATGNVINGVIVESSENCADCPIITYCLIKKFQRTVLLTIAFIIYEEMLGQGNGKLFQLTHKFVYGAITSRVHSGIKGCPFLFVKQSKQSVDCNMSKKWTSGSQD
ncbi:hypothetical protein EGR_10464 [Echinococcus granulosus]|uniref:Uncharacterized protein n=1 Tax=Echinococcus granulosus TaxID=6210 RepID=W6U8D2_ECHGR|nr:hypothetical protein EGR_10464 [Echinococcus granulosus]EUB54682.1 hypothetical protein EGR_10464 [Echinococcus granulosus]